MRFLILFTLCSILFPSCFKNYDKDLNTEINIKEESVKVDDNPPQPRPKIEGSLLDPVFLQACEITSSLD